MKSNFNRPKLVATLLGLALLTGCHKPENAPVAPLQGTSLTVNMPIASVSGSLLGAAVNQVLYQITGPAMQPVEGVAGPFNTPANSGEISFTIPVPFGNSRLLAFQLNDAADEQPLALGAVEMDFTSQPSEPIVVEMGSVGRDCYNIKTSPYNDGSYFTFETDALGNAATVTSPTGYDVDFLPVTVGSAVGFQMNALNSNSLVYLGNGNLVQFAAAPSSGYLASSGAAKQTAGASVTLFQAGDVYCVKFAGGGHAWVQVINAGSSSMGPSFRFRVNTTLPYYAYEQTTIDKSGNCPLPLPTATALPTQTFTNTAITTPTDSPTITPTATPSSTYTLTATTTATDSPTASPSNTTSPLPTDTPTLTATTTDTDSPTTSPTDTSSPLPTDTPTNSPTVTSTFSPTLTPTTTFTPTITFTPTVTYSPTITNTPNGASPITVSGSIFFTIPEVSSGQPLYAILAPTSGGASQVYEAVTVQGGPFTLVSTAGSYNLLGVDDYVGAFGNGGNVPTGDQYDFYQGTLPSNLTPVCTPPASPLITGSVSGLAITVGGVNCDANTQTPIISAVPTATHPPTNTPTITFTPTPTVTPTSTLGSGDIITVAGNGTYGFRGDGGKAVTAELGSPSGIAVDSSGNLYIADSLNNRIRKVDTSGNISTVAGNGTAGYSGDGGSALSAELLQPWGVAVDSSGNIYISDWQYNVVREVSGGVINTIAGYNQATPPSCASNWTGFQGDGGPATCAELQYSTGIAVDSSGNLYIGDTNDRRIREVSGGIINTIAGGGIGSGFTNGDPATVAGLGGPYQAVVDSSSNIYISDLSTYEIYEVSGGNISLLAGNGLQGYSGDGGPGTSAELDSPRGIAVDSSGNVYFADDYNHVIRKINSGGNISTFAGSFAVNAGSVTYGVAGYTGDGGPATLATLNYPAGVAVDSAGNIYIADTSNNVIRKVLH